MLYRVHLATSGIRTHTVVIDTDCTGEDRAFLKCVLRLVIVEYVLLHSCLFITEPGSARVSRDLKEFPVIIFCISFSFLFLVEKMDNLLRNPC